MDALCLDSRTFVLYAWPSHDPMDLSPTERLLLINQSEILARLDRDGADHYAELIEILRDGYEIFYGDLFFPLSHMPAKHSEFVMDALTLYRLIESYKTHFPDDQHAQRSRFAHFEGFCESGEGQMLAFTTFLIMKQRKFPEQMRYRGATNNWHAFKPMTERYARLLDAWHKLGDPYQLSPAHIRDLLG